MLKALLQLGVVNKEQPVTFDYDNQFYNQRGTSERTFDMQNNDFGWEHLPFSFMKENTVFMILTALIRNFYVGNVGNAIPSVHFSLSYNALSMTNGMRLRLNSDLRWRVSTRSTVSSP